MYADHLIVLLKYLIRFSLKLKIRKEHLFLSCQTEKQRQWHLKHSNKLRQPQQRINKFIEALTHFSLFKEREDMRKK